MGSLRFPAPVEEALGPGSFFFISCVHSGKNMGSNPCGERQKKSELEAQLLGHFIFLLSFQALYRNIVKEVV